MASRSRSRSRSRLGRRRSSKSRTRSRTRSRSGRRGGLGKSKSYGKSITRRRFILRDNIQGVKKPELKALAHKAGVKRISGFVYEELRAHVKTQLENVLRDAVTYAEHARRKTVTEADVAHALNRLNLITWVAPENGKKRLSKCKSRSKKKIGGGKHRFKPGTQALRSIRFRQKQHDCVLINPTSFIRLIREIAFDFKTDLRFQAKALTLVQYAVEGYIVKLLEYANLIAINAKRQGIASKDLQTASRLMGVRL